MTKRTLHWFSIHPVLRLVILAVFYFLPTISCARTNYYQLIQEAELKIVSHHFASALETYFAAFKMKQNGKDLLNASFCALYDKQYEKAKELLSCYFQKGGRFPHNDSDLYAYFPSIPQDIIDLVQKNRTAYRNTEVSKARKLIDSLFTIDQYYHIHQRDSMHYYDTITYRCFIDFLRKYGFPEEREGVLDTAKVAGHRYEILIRHYVQSKTFTREDMNWLKELVFSDLLDPTIYAENESLYFNDDFYGNNKVMGLFVRGESGKTYPPILILITANEDEVKRFNAKRKEIGLLSFEQYVEFMKFLFNDQPFCFSNTVYGEPISIEEYNQQKSAKP